MLTQHFFIEDQYLGQALRGPIRFDSSSFQPPLSKAFLCRMCGGQFAKCPITDETGRVFPFTNQIGCCSTCLPDAALLIPGSITCPDPEFLAAFPDAVLQWEVLRHLDQLERSNNGHQAPQHQPSQAL